jgi:hypothetical protein
MHGALTKQLRLSLHSFRESGTLLLLMGMQAAAAAAACSDEDGCITATASLHDIEHGFLHGFLALFQVTVRLL